MNIHDTSRTWLASDLHLGHRGLMDKGVRPLGYEEKFLEAWRHVVRKEDTIILLGDIAFSTQSYWFSRLQEMPGNKVLVLGNHDRNRLPWYKKWGFELVVPFDSQLVLVHEYGNVLLTHIPAFESVLSSYDNTRFVGMSRRLNKIFNVNHCVLNIHGHTHGSATETNQSVDVSLEAINYAPIMFNQVMDDKFKEAA